MKTKIHAAAAVIATLCIAAFFISTIIVEVFGSPQHIALIKRLIVFPGFFILVPAIAVTGGSGLALAGKRRVGLVKDKLNRMPVIAGNGLLVLIPCAIVLNLWASSGTFDARFYAIQALELLAGALNLFLMGKNIRDGLRLTGKLHRKKK